MTPYFNPGTTDRTDIYLGVASDLVGKWAPEPDPIPADYTDKRTRAEALVYDYLLSSQGASLSSISGAPGSFSVAAIADLKSVVRQSMGSYYTAGKFRVVEAERG